jgi:uncharacterized repeat protein (TIGR04052 family)
MTAQIGRWAHGAGTLLLVCCCACGEQVEEPEPQGVTFAVTVNGQPFRCGQRYANMGVRGQGFTVRDLRFYVHDVQLVDDAGQAHALTLDQGGPWQVDDLALLDFEGGEPGCDTGTPEHNAVVHGTLPSGNYRGLRFKLGVPFALNHGDQALAPSPLNLTSLFWTWQGGYKFVRLEGDSDAGAGFIFHLGSTGCDGDLAGGVTHCRAENVVSVELPDYQPGDEVVLDVGALLAGSELEQEPDDVGCMADADDPLCLPLFERLGLTEAGQAQSVFHAR